MPAAVVLGLVLVLLHRAGTRSAERTRLATLRAIQRAAHRSRTCPPAARRYRATANGRVLYLASEG